MEEEINVDELSPLEKKLILNTFMQLKPDSYNKINDSFKLYTLYKDELNPKYLLNELNRNREELGEYVYDIFLNIYHKEFKPYEVDKNESLY